MDGKTARQFVEHLVTSFGKKDILNRKLTYDFLNQGAEEFVSRVECIKKTQDITTIADTSAYDLNADFMKLYLKTDEQRGGEFFVRYDDGTTVYTINAKAYQKVVYDNNDTSVLLPSDFTLNEDTSLPSQVTGTATANGSLSGGVNTLTDASGLFTTTDAVSARDIVHNTTRDASGVVISVTSATALVTAIFDSAGDYLPWTSSDAYVIQPNIRTQLILDPPPSTAGHTVTVYYVAKPNPVYHDWGTWQINELYHKAFCYYAADLYLAQAVQTEGNQISLMVGDKFAKQFDSICRIARKDVDLSLAKSGYSMRWTK